MVPPSLNRREPVPLTSVPTHTLPLTRAHGPDTPGSLPFPLSLSEPFAGEPSAGFQLPPLSVGAPSGLTFASKVSVFVKEITMGISSCQPSDCISDVFLKAIISQQLPPDPRQRFFLCLLCHVCCAGQSGGDRISRHSETVKGASYGYSGTEGTD